MGILEESIYQKSSKAAIGSPQRNLHDILHPLLLEKYSPLLDSFHYKRFVGNEFHPRRGELYISALLSEFNDDIIIEKFKNGGPDFNITLKTDLKFCLEEIVPVVKSTTQDSNQLLKSIEMSIQRKHAKHKKWIREQLITGKEIFIISIGLFGFDSIFILHWNILINQIFKILKDQHFSSISAILLSKDCDQIAMTCGKSILFNDLRLIHNPCAVNPLLLNSLNVFQEYSNEVLVKENACNMTVFFDQSPEKILSFKIKDWRDCYL